MSLIYQTWYATMQNLLVVPLNNSDTNFAQIAPSMIDYAEQRIYRELDLLSTVTTDASKSFTIGNRSLALPASPLFKVLQQVNVITPSGSAPSAGARNPLVPVSKEILDWTWPSVTGTALPTQFAMISDQSIIVGPWPDQAYTVEFVGTIRPAPLSPANTTTFLTSYLPDLFVAASMVFGMGYQRDFSAQSSDPQASQSWESQYQILKQSATVEELRKKWSGANWSTFAASPLATPRRGAA